jgi:hypothetical protein
LTALPVVSVVISCRNRATLLWDCFLGLGAQTLPRERLEGCCREGCWNL